MSKSLFKNFIYKLILNVFNIAVPLIIGSYAIRTLGQDSIGISLHGEAIYQMFYIFASFGIYYYGIREVSRVRDDQDQLKQVFSSLFVIGLIANIIVLIIFITSAVYTEGTSSKGYILYLYAGALFSNIAYVEWANEALEKYDFITIKTIIVKLIYIVLLLKFVKSPDDFVIYSALNCLQITLNNLISYFVIRKQIGFSFKGLTIIPHIKFLVVAMLMSSASYLYVGLDKILLGQFVGESVMASYTTPQNMDYMVYSLIISIGAVTVPRLSYILGSNDEEEYLRILDKVARSMSLFLFPAVMGIYVLHKEIIMLYTGGKVPGAVPVMVIFCFYLITQALDSIYTQQIMYVKKQEKMIIIFMAACGILNLIAKFILIWLDKLSPQSAAISTTIASFLFIICEVIYSRKKLNINIKLMSFDKLKYLIIALGFLPITWGIKLAIHGDIKVSIVTVIGCSLYYGFVLLATKDDIALTVLNKVLIKVRKN